MCCGESPVVCNLVPITGFSTRSTSRRMSILESNAPVSDTSLPPNPVQFYAEGLSYRRSGHFAPMTKVELHRLLFSYVVPFPPRTLGSSPSTWLNTVIPGLRRQHHRRSEAKPTETKVRYSSTSDSRARCWHAEWRCRRRISKRIDM